MTVLPASTPPRLTSAATLELAVVPLPKLPDPLDPHAASVPSEHSTRLKPPPAAMPMIVLPASTPVRSTATGTLLLVVLPLPNCPLELVPHAASVPSVHSARQWSLPAERASTVLPASTPVVSTATAWLLVVTVVCNKRIDNAGVGQIHRLALRQVAKRPLDEIQTGVFHHREIGARCRGISQAQIHRVARCRVTRGSDRHAGGGGETGGQRRR